MLLFTVLQIPLDWAKITPREPVLRTIPLKVLSWKTRAIVFGTFLKFDWTDECLRKILCLASNLKLE